MGIKKRCKIRRGFGQHPQFREREEKELLSVRYTKFPHISNTAMSISPPLPQLIIRFSSTVSVGMAGWIIYDYKTCHPMREMQGYDVQGAFVRFHNTFRPSFTLPTMTLQELSNYDGSASTNNNKVYFGSDGWIWDVSRSQTFLESYGMWKGKEASVSLAKMSMAKEDINRTDFEKLTDSEWKSLHSWTDYFVQKYYICGQLKDFPQPRKR